MAEHQRAVEAMVEDKRRMYEEQKARDEAELAAQRMEDERKVGLCGGWWCRTLWE